MQYIFGLPMRRLARLFRPLHALFALWFAMVLGDPGVLHSCPMHSGHGAGHGAATAAADATIPDAHAMHGARVAEHASHEAPAPEKAPAPCSCVGHCCAVTSVAPLPTVAALHVPEAVAEVRHPLAEPSGDAPASPDLRLPFANGPPTA
jgi:hypothetical protein